MSGSQVVKFDPWDMLNIFCFHVYAQKSLFIGENDNVFLDILIHHTLSCEFANHRAGSQLKMSNVFDSSWEPKVSVTVYHKKNYVISHMSNAHFDPGTCITTFVFMSRLITH